MTEELWVALKAQLIAEGGREKLVEFLMLALAFAELERDKERERDGSYVQ